ncbi:MAG: primosomal protein N' [Clostridiales bacterium]|nr:primosomal protein N' [Clostridiales bacterium]
MIARVIIDQSSTQLDRPFDYSIPKDMLVEKGDRVIVPFGKRTIEGFVIDITSTSEFETKPILQVIDEYKCFSQETLDLMEYMRKRFFLKYVDILRLFIPSALRKGKVRDLERYYVTLNENIDESLIKTQKQKELFEFLKEEHEKPLSELTFLFGASPINSLLKKGVLSKGLQKVDRIPLKDAVAKKKQVTLTPDQEKALKTIFETDKDVILLHGVTGSGKTQVYIEAINKVLASGKNAIMLVPEISLTPQTLKNFRAVFGDKVALLHSGLSDGERYDEWKKLLLNEAKIVVGARSAIFAPLQNIGLIVVDEEHDSSYSSETNPRYKVIDIARFRAKYNNAKVVLGSATPSIETYKLAKDGVYELAKMPKRITDKGMPDFNIVDMKQEIMCGNTSMFSRRLQAAIKETYDKHEQSMLLINRLGYSSFVRCPKCGYVPKCENCDVTLTYHKAENKLACHYCGARVQMFDKCPQCGADKLKFGKIGTETVIEELNKIYPEIRTLKLDSDVKTQKDGTHEVLQQFADKKADVLVGTQMIAKGHDFPDVTLVGLVDADLGLYQQDFRSNERTFQLVTQMAGRAGRADKKGSVILQTYSPTHYVYKYATSYNYDEFYKKEVNIRETTAFPPFVSIVRVMVTHQKREKARDFAREVYKKIREEAKQNKNIRTLAGNEAPINRIKDNFRFQIVMRINKEDELETLSKIHSILDSLDKKDLSIFVEQDPQSLM